MTLHKATKGEFKAIKKLYISAFPKNERAPFFFLKRRAMQNRAELLVAEENGEFVGFVYTVAYKDLIYLFYLAVSKDRRGSGNGSKILCLLQTYYEGKKIFLSREPLDGNAPNNQQRISRRNFYIQNGFVDLPFKVREAVLTYDVMGTNTDIDPNDYNRLIQAWAGAFALRFIKLEYVD